MEISQSRLESLAETHGRYASWAVWNPDNQADAQIIFSHCEDLKTSVVMVGLNASRAVRPTDYTNETDNELICVIYEIYGNSFS